MDRPCGDLPRIRRIRTANDGCLERHRSRCRLLRENQNGGNHALPLSVFPAGILQWRMDRLQLDYSPDNALLGR